MPPTVLPRERDSAPDSHPPGLYVLFFTELWERYSFYSMMAILTLYMDERLRFPQALSGQIYGAYVAAVFFMPLVGGALADRWLGFYRAVIAGAILMGIGQFVLGMPSLPAFFTALALLACGTGLLKPSISNIVGNLYADRPQLRDAGFNIFYMGINIGAFIAPILVAWLRAHQRDDGGFTQTAVNGVFFGSAMLDYRLYQSYFPAWALARHARLSGGAR
jgi:POT family proton-dependent oligopeptide transporter